jgi:hypothetical protein
MKVIPSLHKQPGFGTADGWKLRTWSAKLSTPEAKCAAPVTRQHSVHYLFNAVTGHVITSRHKGAWNDQVCKRAWNDQVCM